MSVLSLAAPGACGILVPQPRRKFGFPALGGRLLITGPPGKFLFSSCIDYTGFPVSSAGKESTCNGGAPGSIPGLESSLGEGIGYQFQYSWASLVAHIIKNPPTMQETRVWCLGWEGPLEVDMATHSSILAWRIPKVTKSWTWLSDWLCREHVVLVEIIIFWVYWVKEYMLLKLISPVSFCFFKRLLLKNYIYTGQASCL